MTKMESTSTAVVADPPSQDEQRSLRVARLVVAVPVLLMLVAYVANIYMAATHQL
jgi:hypothetical protein